MLLILLIRLMDGSWIWFLSSLGCLLVFGMPILSTMRRCGCGSKLAGGLGLPWSRDGGIPQGCTSSMMFIVALYFALV